MRTTALLVSLLFAAVGSVAAQPTSQPKQPESERKAAGEPRLNLRLDEADLRDLSRSGSRPPVSREDKTADGLPTLGGDARKIDTPAPSSSDSRRPYPIDSQMISR